MGKVVNEIGNVYGRLTVVEPAGKDASKKALWKCICVCGNVLIGLGTGLRYGQTISCGCLTLELRSTHGMTKTPEYRAWLDAKNRCNNLDYAEYKNYGGRGIKFYSGWENDFQKFFDHIGPRPKGASLERINNEGNYEPGNVKWATRKEQERNKRSNHMLKYLGTEQCAVEWTEDPRITIDIAPSTLLDRVNKLGWTDEEALTTPVKRRKS